MENVFRKKLKSEKHCKIKNYTNLRKVTHRKQRKDRRQRTDKRTDGQNQLKNYRDRPIVGRVNQHKFQNKGHSTHPLENGVQ